MKGRKLILFFNLVVVYAVVSCVSAPKNKISYNHKGQKTLTIHTRSIDNLKNLCFPDSVKFFYDIEDTVADKFSRFGT